MNSLACSSELREDQSASDESVRGQSARHQVRQPPFGQRAIGQTATVEHHSGLGIGHHGTFTEPAAVGSRASPRTPECMIDAAPYRRDTYRMNLYIA